MTGCWCLTAKITNCHSCQCLAAPHRSHHQPTSLLDYDHDLSLSLPIIIWLRLYQQSTSVVTLCNMIILFSVTKLIQRKGCCCSNCSNCVCFGNPLFNWLAQQFENCSISFISNFKLNEDYWLSKGCPKKSTLRK